MKVLLILTEYAKKKLFSWPDCGYCPVYHIIILLLCAVPCKRGNLGAGAARKIMMTK
jgi:hypothetical protein